MKTRRRVLTGVTFFIAAAWVLTPSVAQFFGQEALNKLHEQGIRIRVDGLAGTRVGLSAELLETWLPVPLDGKKRVFPVSLRLENPLVSLKVPPLSPWSPKVTFEGASYGGEIDGTMPLLGAITGRPSVDLTVTGADVSLHPQARALGVEAGTIDAKIQQHPLQGLPHAEARYSLQLRGLELNLPPMIAQVAKVAAVSDASLDAAATVSPSGSFTLSPCILKSSLGEITLSAQGTASDTTIKDARGQIRFDLSGEQGAQLRPWLGLLVPAARLPADGPIQCDYRVGPCSGPSSNLLRLGSACVRMECGA